MGASPDDPNRFPRGPGAINRLYGTDFDGAPHAESSQSNPAERKGLRGHVFPKKPVLAAARGLALDGILSSKVAQKSYFNLLRRGLKSREFFQIVIGMAVYLSRPRREGTQRGNSNWMLGSGKNAKTLGYFPRRVRGLADEIEILNRHPLLRPDQWVKARKIPEAQKAHFRKWFTRLPILLRYYASFVENHSKAMSTFLGRLRSTRKPRTEALTALIAMVRAETGNPRLPDLANILTSVADTAGLSEKESAGLGVDALKDLDAKARRRKTARRNAAFYGE